MMKNSLNESVAGFLFLLSFVLLAVIFLPTYERSGMIAAQTADANETNLPINVTQYGFSGADLDIQGSPRSPLEDQRVFAFGDSQIEGHPGEALSWHLTAKGATYYARAGQSGWGTLRWLQNKNSLQRLILRHSPTLIIIGLGGNDWHRAENLNYPLEISELWNHIKATANEAVPYGKRLSICWLSPVTVVGSRANELNGARDKVAETILHIIGRKHFVDVRDITGEFGRTPDGIHFTPGGANDFIRQTVPLLETCIENQR